MLDRDLAALYGIENRVLKQTVRRNARRFPDDFMFHLNDEEVDALVSQTVMPHKRIFGGSNPMVFTEQGVAMLSSVLRSVQAIEVSRYSESRMGMSSHRRSACSGPRKTGFPG